MDEDKTFRLMSQIMRASHFEWRRAALSFCPGANPHDLVRAYWREVAKDTAAHYAGKIDPSGDVAAQFARLIVASSRAMNEEAVAPGKDGQGREEVIHTACPWADWHRRLGLVDEDRLGCDEWLFHTSAEINRRLGTRLVVETVETLPEGAACCRRRVFVE